MRQPGFKSVFSSPTDRKQKFPFFPEADIAYFLEELKSKITVEEKDSYFYLITPTDPSITIKEERISETERYFHLFLSNEKIATSIPHMKKTTVYLKPPREEVEPDDIMEDFVFVDIAGPREQVAGCR